jgi:type I restriction enzyme S subunit
MKTTSAQVGDLALNESGAFKIGPFGSSLKKSELVDAGIPVAGIENVLANEFVKGFRRFITPRKFEDLSDYEIRAGDVLVTTMGTIGRAAVAPPGLGRAIIDSHLFRMRVDTKRIFTSYLCYALNSNHVAIQLSQKARGAIMDGLNTTILRECSIPLPGLPEQQWIAEQLEKADRLRRISRYALELTDTFLPATFTQLFGEPVRNTHGWPVETLSELGEVTTGGTPPTERPGMFGGTIPFLTPGDLEANTAHPNRYLTEAGASESGTVRAGSTMVCCIGATIGKTDIARVRSAFNQQINAVGWGDRINDSFGVYLMRFFGKVVADRGRSTTLPILKKSAFEEIRVPVPPLPMQQRFAKLVARHEHLFAVQRESLRQAQHLFQTLLHGAFANDA